MFSLGMAMHQGWNSYVNGYGALDPKGDSVLLAELDAFKDMLADRLSLAHTPAASMHLYPASFAFWSSLDNRVDPAPRGSAFPSRELMQGLRVRGITPMVYWEPISYVLDVSGRDIYAVWQNWADGMHDAYLDTWAQAANAWRDSDPGGLTLDCGPQRNEIIFRMSQEFNADWFPWGIATTGEAAAQGNTNASFIAGWRHIHDRIRVYNGADHVKMWYVPQWGSASAMGAMYPGDNYVQYMGYDRYVNFGSGVAEVTPSLHNLHDGTIANCRLVSSRPIIVGETGVGGGLGTTAYPGTAAQRAAWFTDDGGIAALQSTFPDLRGITYFNIDTGITGGFPDWTLDRTSQCVDAWATAKNTFRDRYVDL